jgi:cytidine deaminase
VSPHDDRHGPPNELETALLAAAREAAQHARVPNSGFRVGAALADGQGRMVAGCNVESVISGMGTCAERNALHQAVAQGLGAPVAIVVFVADSPPVTPCGMCREAIRELAPQARVLCGDAEGHLRRFTIAELLPAAFELPDSAQ